MTTESDPRAELRTIDAVMSTVDLIAFNAQAVRTSIGLVEQLTTADLGKPTPCADWTLHGLLTHMIAQHHGFAAASHGNGDPAQWKSRPLGADPVRSYREAAEQVIEAFAEPGVLDRKFPLAEFSADYEFSGTQAVSFHFIDYVVHSWDVAKTLGLTVRFDDELIEAAFPVAQAVPGGDFRLLPGSAFAPELAWSSVDRLDQIVALLGRSPEWPR
ncbi:TIGR03086 family metal-binding protein [Nocardia sp. NBC_01499]|uniref:TIGR03086 family metal-binding protein n=1 Tax=Nocardia sp. NBC_01499 TaxID=2903597 RepID=UPI0038660882